MLIQVDGWVYQVPEEVEYIEFFSSHESGHAGSAIGYNKHGAKLDFEFLPKKEIDIPWWERIDK